jgi:SecY
MTALAVGHQTHVARRRHNRCVGCHCAATELVNPTCLSVRQPGQPFRLQLQAGKRLVTWPALLASRRTGRSVASSAQRRTWAGNRGVWWVSRHLQEVWTWAADLYSSWYTWHALFIVARRVAVNVAGLSLLILGQAIPLCHGDYRGLPEHAMTMLNFASLTDNPLPAHLHPFLLSIVPHTNAQIFMSGLGGLIGWHNIPKIGLRSASELHTMHGSQKVNFVMNLVGAAFTAVVASWLTNKLLRLGMCGTTEWLSVATALMAGSSLSVLVCNAITVHGLGNGIGFIYMAGIANSTRPPASTFALYQLVSPGLVYTCSCLLMCNACIGLPVLFHEYAATAGMRQQWHVLAAQSLSLAQGAQVAGVFAIVTAACVVVNTLSYAAPLQHANISRAASQNTLMDELRPKLTMQLCPYCSLVRRCCQPGAECLLGGSYALVAGR